MDLRADQGCAVLDGSSDASDAIPVEVSSALTEWASVVQAVLRDGRPTGAVAELISRRGRQLASRVAAVTGQPVHYHDPMNGGVESVPVEAGASSADASSADVPRADVSRVGVARTDEPPAGEPSRAVMAGGAVSGSPVPGPLVPGPSIAGNVRVGGPAAAVWRVRGEVEPTPWATGLTLSVFTAVVVTVAVVALSTGLADISRLLAAIANFIIAAGLAPSVWLARRTPVWRWVALGTTFGTVISWFALLLLLLGD